MKSRLLLKGIVSCVAAPGPLPAIRTELAAAGPGGDLVRTPDTMSAYLPRGPAVLPRCDPSRSAISVWLEYS